MDMLFDRFKALLADDMFDTAGVIVGNFFWYAKLLENLSDNPVPFIDHLCHSPAFVRQEDVTGVGHGNLMLLAKVSHGDADAGLLEIKLIGHIDGANHGELPAQN